MLPLVAMAASPTLVQPAARLATGRQVIGPRRSASPATGKIQHVVIVIQENRTVDNLFNGYCAPSGECANTVNVATIVPTPPPNKPSPLPSPTTVPLSAVSLTEPYDITHESTEFTQSTDNGKMDLFDWEGGQNKNGSWWGGVGCYTACKGYRAPRYPEIGYVPAAEIKPYVAIANTYVLFDNLFASNIDESFAAHQFLIAAQSGGNETYGGAAVNTPNYSWGCGGPEPQDQIETLTVNRTLGTTEAPCLNYTTLGDELTGAGLGWSYYAPGLGVSGYFWSAYQAIAHICGPVNPTSGACTGALFAKHVLSPETQFLTDVPNGNLATVTWVVPDFQNSDHPSSRSLSGPAWVAKVVNAVGTSAFWDSTAIFVVWDDWGGWYDHVSPPYLDYMGLGLRVPMLVVSPYAVRASVTSVCDGKSPSGPQYYEFGSILRFAEDDFGLAQMAASDTRAADPANDPCVFDFTQKPRTFAKIPL